MMKITDKRSVIKRISAARARVNKEIEANAKSGSVYMRGLAGEGYAGGYRDALNDVEAALTHGYVNCGRHYWDTGE